MKYTLLITQECNLACEYCYIGKKRGVMSRGVAEKVIDFMFAHTPADEQINAGFFGGEPLLEFELIKAIVRLIESHPRFDARRVELTVATNGTLFSPEIADFMIAHEIGFGISCDGAPFVHDRFRRFPDGSPTGQVVENTIREALAAFTLVPINAVFHPQTLQYLPQSVEYLASLGIRQIYLNPDLSAPWTKEDADLLPGVFEELAEQYIAYYLQEVPRFISPIDSKITVIMRGGYDPLERCRMGTGEFAFTPDGGIYPCERLVGAGTDVHRIGHVDDGPQIQRMSCRMAAGSATNEECLRCGLSDYCMNWCGCSNYFESGYYNRVGPFLCACEKAAIRTAFSVFERLENELGPVFADHVSGLAISNSNTR